MKIADLKKMAAAMAGASELQDRQQLSRILEELGYDPGNVYQELEMSSRFVDTHRDTSYANHQVQLHSHPFYELIYCRSSVGVEYLLGAERYRLQRGDILLAPPEISHRPLLPEQMAEPYKRYVIWINADFLHRMAETFGSQNVIPEPRVCLIRTAGTRWEGLRDLFRTGVEEAEAAAPGWETAVVGNTLLLLAKLRRAMEDPGTKPMAAERPGLLDKVLAYVEENLAQKISLEDVAARFWVSQSTISQTFRTKMGVSFYRCVTQRRLIAAKTLIDRGISLEEVGHKVGFADYSTFYRAFKKEYGISPRHFRKLREADTLP